jgi:hypothetical protein
MSDDRIEAAQAEIARILAAKPEYVVNTSEFGDVKTRLAMLQNRRRVDSEKDSNSPHLRRAPGTGASPAEEGGDQKRDEDDRPRLKRQGNQWTLIPLSWE